MQGRKGQKKAAPWICLRELAAVLAFPGAFQEASRDVWTLPLVTQEGVLAPELVSAEILTRPLSSFSHLHLDGQAQLDSPAPARAAGAAGAVHDLQGLVQPVSPAPDLAVHYLEGEAVFAGFAVADDDIAAACLQV
jgi:hypothetical protein